MMLKQMWDNLCSGDQQFIIISTYFSSGIVLIITWIVLLIAMISNPDVQYECSQEQAKFVERTIKDCLSQSDRFMSTCSQQARETYCTPAKE